MRQGAHRDIQRQFLAVFRADAFAFIAGIVGAEGAAQTILTHHGHEVAFVKKTF